MIGFAYSLIAVGFRAILMSFFSFVNQKTYSGNFLRPEVILSRNYPTKCSIWPTPLSSSILSFFKNAINSEPLGVRSYYFQDFHNSVIPTTSKNFSKIRDVKVTYPGWFIIELPNEASFPLCNRYYDHCKNVFHPFS